MVPVAPGRPCLALPALSPKKKKSKQAQADSGRGLSAVQHEIVLARKER